jgi:hypothetical protein
MTILLVALTIVATIASVFALMLMIIVVRGWLRRR